MKRVNHWHRNRRRGMTLVEMVCALALLSIVFSGFISLALSAAQQNSRTLAQEVAFETATRTLLQSPTTEGSFTLQVGGTAYTLQVKIKRAEGMRLTLYEPGG